MISLCLILACGVPSAPQAVSSDSVTSIRQHKPARKGSRDTWQTELLDSVQRRAFRFFWEQADAATGLVKDRAGNFGPDDYTVASIASTGYALASLPIAVERHMVPRDQAQQRAEQTLTFILDKMSNVHGWYYHFVDMHTGARVWSCELSSIDTCLLVAGALVCGQYFHGTPVQALANRLYDGMDWTWMHTNGGARPEKVLVSMGWKPESGFLNGDWSSYCELMLLYLLGLGAKRGALPPASWDAWKRPLYEYGGLETLAGGPIFLHEMAHEFYNFKGLRDRLGYDYWVSSLHATEMNRKYCIDLAPRRKTYGPNVWGLNASDGPKGYTAYGVPQPEDGTVSPTGAVAALLFISKDAIAAGEAIRTKYGRQVWGRYGFSNAFNVDAGWYDKDVIGIDLGMAMLGIEDYRTGLVWKLLASHPATGRAMKAAGLHAIPEREPRPLRVQPSP